MDFVAEHYLVWKSLHIIAVICWMAAILYLPRLFVYHAQAINSSESADRFSVMEQKLLHGIATPAMIGTYIFGIMLILSLAPYILHSYWFMLKIICVLILSGFHGFCTKQVRRFKNNTNQHSEKFYRIVNEIPALIMIIIVFLVVLKPFSG